MRIDDSEVTQQESFWHENGAGDQAIRRVVNTLGLSSNVEVISVKPSTHYNKEQAVLVSDKEENTFLVTLNINDEETITVPILSMSNMVPTEEELKEIQGKALSTYPKIGIKTAKVINTELKASSSKDFKFYVDGIKKSYKISDTKDPNLDYHQCLRELAKENDPSMNYEKIDCTHIKELFEGVYY
ncbi:hypothetical protein IIW_04949 [Bacillus cereus VD136]|nr:hypothetical protein IIW_04949 [Bacillus cereus VD136]EOP72158.1 hypothetical protein KOW_05361 [Bacillus cereus VDM006]